jgi:hypothetical protein
MSEPGLLAQYGMTGHVLAAYSLTWLVVVVYAVYVGARVRRAASALAAEIAREEERS